MRIHPRTIAVAAAAALILAPAGAQAAGKTVSAGPPERPKGAPEAADVNAYFPAKVKVAKGGTVKFAFNGFHDVYFGRKPVGLVKADPGKPISGVNDAAGNPFWFNGQPRLALNPVLMSPTGDGRVDGKSVDGSGLPLSDGPPKPYKAKFTKTGTFTYLCNVHPGMKGKVTVVNKRKRIPSARADRAAATRQLAKAVKRLKKLDAYAGPGGANVRVGNDTRELALLKFFPGNVSAAVGEPVKFQFPGTSAEIHNVAVTPDAYGEEQSKNLIAPDMSSTPPALVLNPIVFYPSDPPTAFPAHSPTLHGNGFINTGVLDTEPATPFPNQAQITFSAPGTYTYYCLIHAPDMRGTVTVTG